MRDVTVIRAELRGLGIKLGVRTDDEGRGEVPECSYPSYAPSSRWATSPAAARARCGSGGKVAAASRR